MDNPFLTSPTPPTASVLFDTEEGSPVINDFEEAWKKIEGETLARRSRGWAIGDKELVLEVVGSVGYDVHREGSITMEGTYA